MEKETTKSANASYILGMPRGPTKKYTNRNINVLVILNKA